MREVLGSTRSLAFPRGAYAIRPYIVQRFLTDDSETLHLLKQIVFLYIILRYLADCPVPPGHRLL